MRSIRHFALPVLALALYACDNGGGGADSGVDAHQGSSESCQRITDACHEVDPGTGPIHDCHETAHDVGTDEACGAIEVDCVALCVAAAGDGGVADDGGEHVHDDGGEYDHDGGEHAHDGGEPAHDGGEHAHDHAGAAPDAG